MDEIKAIALIKSMLNKPIKEMKSEIENIKEGGAGGSSSTSMLINLTYDGTKYVCSPNFATIKEYLMTASLDDWPIVQMKHDALDIANNTIKRTIYTATGMGHADDIIKHEMKWIDFMFTLSDGRAVTIRYNSDNTIAEVSE